MTKNPVRCHVITTKMKVMRLSQRGSSVSPADVALAEWAALTQSVVMRHEKCHICASQPVSGDQVVICKLLTRAEALIKTGFTSDVTICSVTFLLPKLDTFL